MGWLVAMGLYAWMLSLILAPFSPVAAQALAISGACLLVPLVVAVTVEIARQ